MKYKLNYELDKNNFIYELLQHKGIEDIDRFLFVSSENEEDVYHLDNILQGIKSLKYAIQQRQRIGVIVDSDGDGFLSSALFYFFFKYINYDNIEFIFHEEKAHGIILNEIPNSLGFLICPDAATSDYEQHEELKNREIDILVLDHHEATNGESPFLNICTINNQLSQNYKNKALCGTGITFKFLKEYCEIENIDLNMDEYLDLVGIAIIGDVMDLSTLENRFYVEMGLHNIRNPFFKALVDKRAFNIGTRTPTPTDVAFYLIPAINAIIRMGTMEEKKILFNAIVDGDREVPSTKRGHSPNDIEIAKEQAIRLCDNAISRQRRERTKIAELLQSRIAEQGWENDKVIIGQYYTKDNINSNLTGLAAMELANTYQRPALVVHYNEEEDTWSGSARNYGSAIPDLKQFFEESNLFEYTAGHANAHGLQFKNSNLQAIREYCNSTLANINYTTDNIYQVDYICDYMEPMLITIIVNIDKWRGVWGHGVEEPLLCIRNIPIQKDDILVMGTNEDSFKFTRNSIAYVRFKDMDFYNELTKDNEIKYLTVVCRANMNFWQGRSTPQLLIQDYNIESIYDF